MKLEYVNQLHQNYPHKNILSGGKFNGFVAEAFVGF